MPYPVGEQRAVRKARQGVVVGEVVDPFFLADVLERKGNVARKLLQQLDLLVVEKIGLFRKQ